MHFNAYGGNGAALAAALVNATDFRPPAVEAMLTEHRLLHAVVTSAEAEELRVWARRLGPVFGELDQDTQIKLVNELLDVTASKPYVSAHGGREPHLHFYSPDADIVSRAKDTTAGGLAMCMSFAGGSRLGRCDREGCGIVYVDTSRNGRRRFCSLACANRVNVAAHRARQVAR
ncbi:CGNR zinc finger domain-containing protein [Nonomuraea basaltis]|uniref:CGNR zinc finger domain-containing protein n=1 Tax=Nonomuraea basaltis TaxID=2495887 RepID=UPI00110C5363|nr:CGNR zinc finger domain-containing protein [Nonomuraea basaltis]TMR90906.1 CGNR zinc finger domain-containing protein [Nonomuraea basaltis]